MMLNNQQKQAIQLLNPWRSGAKVELGIERTSYLKEISEILDQRKQILFLIGSRRVGKTVIMLQYIYQLIAKGVSPDEILFLSLDNTNLANLDLFTYLSSGSFKYIFLDEVHFFPNWAKVLKSLYDLTGFKSKLICSGSSIKAIEANKTYLTGRSTTINVTPLAFREFMEFDNQADQTNKGALNNYLKLGGYPEYVIEKHPNYLNELLRDVIEKDLVRIYNIRRSEQLFEICHTLAKQVGFKASPTKIAKVLGLDNKTVSTYIEYLQGVRLIDSVYQFSPSINKRLYAPKKYYFNDLGMRNSFTGFTDRGSLVENAVFIRLRELYGNNIFYFSDTSSNEIDFVVDVNSSTVLFVESKFHDLSEKVLNSLNKAFFGELPDKKVLKRLVVTNEINETVIYNKKTIELISLENFLLLDTEI